MFQGCLDDNNAIVYKESLYPANFALHGPYLQFWMRFGYFDGKKKKKARRYSTPLLYFF